MYGIIPAVTSSCSKGAAASIWSLSEAVGVMEECRVKETGLSHLLTKNGQMMFKLRLVLLKERNHYFQLYVRTDKRFLMLLDNYTAGQCAVEGSLLHSVLARV